MKYYYILLIVTCMFFQVFSAQKNLNIYEGHAGSGIMNKEASLFISGNVFDPHDVDTWLYVSPALSFKKKTPRRASSPAVAKLALDSTIISNYMKTVYVYDTNGRCVTKLDLTFDSVNCEWINDDKYEYAYDGNGNLKCETQYDEWDSSANIWEDIGKYEYADDSYGNVLTSDCYSWNYDSSSWIFDYGYKYEYTYDGAGNIMSRISYSRFSAADSLSLSGKAEYTYDNYNNLQLMQGYYSYNTGTGLWNFSLKYKYETEYDAAGNMISQAVSDSISNAWKYLYKTEYSYDDNKNISTIAVSEWDSVSNGWGNYYKGSYTYDLGVSADDIIIPTGSAFVFNNKIIGYSVIIYDTSSGLWNSALAMDFYYSAINVPVITPPPVKQHSLSMAKCMNGVCFVYSSDITATASFYSASGRRIMRSAVKPGKKLDLSCLSRGFYTVEFAASDGTCGKYKILIE